LGGKRGKSPDSCKRANLNERGGKKKGKLKSMKENRKPKGNRPMSWGEAANRDSTAASDYNVSWGGGER